MTSASHSAPCIRCKIVLRPLCHKAKPQWQVDFVAMVRTQEVTEGSQEEYQHYTGRLTGGDLGTAEVQTS